MLSRLRRRRSRKKAVIWPFIIGVAIIVGLAPMLVNSAAYVAGAGGTDTFNPVSHSQRCGKYNCHTVTNGHLSGSGAHVTVDDDVPLDVPFPVRVPVWAWGTGRNPLTGEGQAILYLILSEFAILFALQIVYSSIRNAIERRAERRSQQAVADG